VVVFIWLYDDMVLRKRIVNGVVPGPRILTSGHGISPRGGQFPDGTIEDSLILKDYLVIASVEEAIKSVHELVENGADLIKVFPLQVRALEN
jgi:imidazolonepropionase-like amidohydrolase